MRYRVHAWGSDIYPDIEGEYDGDEVHMLNLGAKYPMMNICLIDPVPYEEVVKALAE